MNRQELIEDIVVDGPDDGALIFIKRRGDE
jgi:hypothetical protein